MNERGRVGAAVMPAAPRIAVLASGEGQTLQALIDACTSAELSATVALLVTNRGNAGAAERARRHGIAVAHISHLTHADPGLRDAAIEQALQHAQVDYVVLAGYLKQLGSRVLTRFAGRIINLHPTLLPRFGGAGMYGRNVHATVIASGAEQSGASIHYVTRDYDTGPVIAQRELAIIAGDTPQSLESRIKPLEQQLLIAVLQQLFGHGVPLLARLSCPVGYVIQTAAPRHLVTLPAIELAAAAIFSSIDLPASWATDTTPLAELEQACRESRIVVALTRDDVPVGYALVDTADGAPHLEEMDVHPDHARRGIGAALVRNVQERARVAHAKSMTLTTFAHIAWNAPFYARHGFVRVDASNADPVSGTGPELRRILAAERAGGLKNRIAMRAVL